MARKLKAALTSSAHCCQFLGLSLGDLLPGGLESACSKPSSVLSTPRWVPTMETSALHPQRKSLLPLNSAPRSLYSVSWCSILFKNTSFHSFLPLPSASPFPRNSPIAGSYDPPKEPRLVRPHRFSCFENWERGNHIFLPGVSVSMGIKQKLISKWLIPLHKGINKNKMTSSGKPCFVDCCILCT